MCLLPVKYSSKPSLPAIRPRPQGNAAKLCCVLSQVRGHKFDQPISNTKVTWYTDGSSFIYKGQSYMGTTAVSDSKTVWISALPTGTAAQGAQLIALTKALNLGKDKWVNIYNDNRYAFGTAHIQGVIYQERGLLTAEEKTTKTSKKF